MLTQNKLFYKKGRIDVRTDRQKKMFLFMNEMRFTRRLHTRRLFCFLIIFLNHYHHHR